MKTLRKTLAACLAGLALMASTVGTSTAQAGHGHHQARYYVVYYRTCVHSAWVPYYSFTCPVTAQSYANWIRAGYGYETYIY